MGPLIERALALTALIFVLSTTNVNAIDCHDNLDGAVKTMKDCTMCNILSPEIGKIFQVCGKPGRSYPKLKEVCEATIASVGFPTLKDEVEKDDAYKKDFSRFRTAAMCTKKDLCNARKEFTFTPRALNITKDASLKNLKCLTGSVMEQMAPAAAGTTELAQSGSCDQCARVVNIINGPQMKMTKQRFLCVKKGDDGKDAILQLAAASSGGSADQVKQQISTACVEPGLNNSKAMLDTLPQGKSDMEMAYRFDIKYCKEDFCNKPVDTKLEVVAPSDDGGTSRAGGIVLANFFFIAPIFALVKIGL